MATPRNTDLKGSLAARLAPFEALDACHREVVSHLQTLNRLVLHLDAQGLDDQARSMAAEVVRFFNETAQQHHAEEERVVFPSLLAGNDLPMLTNAARTHQAKVRAMAVGRAKPKAAAKKKTQKR